MVNPNRLDETSPHGALAAVGVAFLLAVAVNRALREAGWYADAARARPAAMARPRRARHGMRRRAADRGQPRAGRAGHPGRAAAAAIPGCARWPRSAASARRSTPIISASCSGPRVNAGGRVGAADLGARLLASDDPAEAARTGRSVSTPTTASAARSRRETLEAAIAAVEAGPQSPALVFAAAEGWHPGVIGIVAARLKERYQRPACVVAMADGIGKGSGRSVPGVALGPAVIAARQAGLLVNGGGHAMAAGFTVAADRLDALRAFLAERLGDGIDRERLVPLLSIDGALSAAGAISGLIAHIDALAPFGAANPEPRFAFPAIRLAHVEPVGTGHLRCTLADAAGSGEGAAARLNAIAFRAADTPLGQFLAASRGRAIHVAGHLGATPIAAATRSSSSSTTPRRRRVKDQPRPERRSSVGQFRDARPSPRCDRRRARPRRAVLGQHGAGEFAELGADLRFGKRLVEIAAMAVAGMRRLPCRRSA